MSERWSTDRPEAFSDGVFAIAEHPRAPEPQARHSRMFEAHRRKHHHGSNHCWRLSFEKGHSVFQIELAIDELDPVVIPGPVGTPPRETTDPVEILNSVVVDGWKFVDGEFVHVELRNGLIGCYLFQRSSKRWREMGDTWPAL